ncbi:3-hydroxyacyl-ACP dehydratase FabZ [Streptomyces sp. NPDC059009]|uniref:3-hydroxyacyl-ACP dehydratase FabZ n=1 Tax=Streptomyces sp. NPDC059009 TaxID=3346694 RepID=UPI0036C08E8A
MTAGTTPPVSFSADEIRGMLPHRWPLLLVDRAYDVHPGRSGKGIKNVTVNEPYFAGHYPNQSIMPGVLLVEAMAQLVAVVYVAGWLADGQEDGAEQVGYLGAIRNMKFTRLVVPGDRLTLEAALGRRFGPLTHVTVKASVDGETAAEGTLTVSRKGGRP